MRPSARLVRAVAAERADLERQRAQLAREAAELRAALARIEHGLEVIDAQRGLLDRIVEPDEQPPAPAPAVRDGRALRGPAIRAAAVAVLVAQGADAAHYRDWYALLVQAGFEVAGKDPLAVFLTQITRSPVVRKGSQTGVYELDHEAPSRLHARLEQLHRELKELAGDDLTAIRARRAEITQQIQRTEKALDEATRVLQTRDAA